MMNLNKGNLMEKMINKWDNTSDEFKIFVLVIILMLLY